MHVVIPVVAADAHANPSVCASCGGKCCKTMPGALFPQDLDPALRREVLAAKVLALLESGHYTLDWYEGDPFSGRTEAVRAYYLRPAIRGHEGQWSDASWGGTCTFHGPAGCALSERARPRECRALIPEGNGTCYKPAGWEIGGRRLAAQAWWSLRDMLSTLESLEGETEKVRLQYAARL